MIRRLLPLLLFIACHSTTSPLQTSALWLGLTPGPHAVGAHIGAVTTWYPAHAAGEQLRFRDYIPKLEDVDAFLHAQKISDATIVALFDSPMQARRDAPSRGGRFPIVAVFQGNGETAADQAVLAEFIASHGYVVVTIPGPVVNAEAEIAAKAEEQAEAMVAALRDVNADHMNVRAIGHSFGARSMIRFAARTPTRALVSLDGGIGTATAPAAFDGPLPPLLHIYEDLDSFMKPDFTFLRSLKTKSLLIERMDAMHHVHFSTWGFVAGAFPELGTATQATEATKTSVAAVARRVVGFLESN